MLLPSKIGGSTLSISMRTLSIPRPDKAERKCSTVYILILSIPIVVPLFVSITYSTFAGMVTEFSKSVLLNTIPELGGDGYTAVSYTHLTLPTTPYV